MSELPFQQDDKGTESKQEHFDPGLQSAHFGTILTICSIPPTYQCVSLLSHRVYEFLGAR